MCLSIKQLKIWIWNSGERKVTRDLDEETISVIWQKKPWESMGLDKKQGEQEEKITKKTTLKNIHT